MNSSHPLVPLTLTRIREFTREREAVFWAVLFPVLLATGLGVAFAGKPTTVLKVAAVSPEITRALKAEPGLDVTALSSDAARIALRDGKVAMVAEPSENGGVAYRYDDTNPEGRTARLLADAAVQRAAGRRDPANATDAITREPRSRYIAVLAPGLIGG